MADDYPVFETTEEHFKLFKQTVMEWVKRFGLLDWDIVFDHAENGENSEWSLGRMSSTAESSSARIILFKKWKNCEPTDNDIRRTAIHEFCHLLTDRLYNMAQSRFLTESELDTECERLARQFENAFYPIEVQ